MQEGTIVYIVHIHVREGFEKPFIEATKLNREGTRKEEGNIRFDLLQQNDKGSEFILYEVYSSQYAVDEHKKTEHYARWRDTVEVMMEKPRTGIKYSPLLAD